ncbi:hypothetical protein SLEP1_g45008 [Rubroshorea leprosula]|uniref:Uncharacterized protein n=1 Tax=Rubroshorea leprosula TaxID=152421 RepID=A0AAV5LJ36_9ROSI|nr:hypothetical protein SLEP1_g45008 [Rubroshorea leprosula]
MVIKCTPRRKNHHWGWLLNLLIQLDSPLMTNTRGKEFF